MNFLIVPLALLFNLSLCSQNTKIVKKKEQPISIYTISNPMNIHGGSAINKRLNLSTFKFLFSFNHQTNDDFYFYQATVASENLGKKTRSFLTEDTKFFFDSFIRKNDATKWPARYFEYK